jgi:hypothetical protein
MTNGCNDNWIKMCFDSEATALKYVQLGWKWGYGSMYVNPEHEPTNVEQSVWSKNTHEEVKQWNNASGDVVTEPKLITMAVLANITKEEQYDELDIEYALMAVDDEDNWQ